VIPGNGGLGADCPERVSVFARRENEEQRYDVVSWGRLRRLEHREKAEKFYRDLRQSHPLITRGH